MNLDVLKPDATVVAEMDKVLLDDMGRIRMFPADFYRQFSTTNLRSWCHYRARYGIVTLELCNWLRNRIGGRQAMEVAAGMGDLGYWLGIPMTDSYQQVEDEMTSQVMQLTGQPPTRPPVVVYKEDAQTAVIRYRPKVVVASWLTQRRLHGDTTGNYLGPREEVVLDHCQTYIHIGNEIVHGHKRILARQHERFHFPWLVSRARNPAQNVIYVWDSHE